jgi:hypothetical protein
MAPVNSAGNYCTYYHYLSSHDYSLFSAVPAPSVSFLASGAAQSPTKNCHRYYYDYYSAASSSPFSLSLLLSLRHCSAALHGNHHLFQRRFVGPRLVRRPKLYTPRFVEFHLGCLVPTNGGCEDNLTASLVPCRSELSPISSLAKSVSVDTSSTLLHLRNSKVSPSSAVGDRHGIIGEPPTEAEI